VRQGSYSNFTHPIRGEKREKGVHNSVGSRKDVPVGEAQHGVTKRYQAILTDPVSLKVLGSP